MPFVGAEVKTVFEELKQRISPDMIFTHNRKDAHQDHRLISELTWNTFRDHLILEYEIPKYDGDMGQPSVFVPLDSEVCQKKVRNHHGSVSVAALQTVVSKRTRFSRSCDCAEWNATLTSGYAEAFYCRKLVL